MKAVDLTPRTRRRIAVGIVVGILAAVVGVIAWIGVRAWLASTELREAEPLVGQVRQAIAIGDADAATASASRLAVRMSTAADLTNDPVWRAAEVVPWVGDQLAAVRVVSRELDLVASDAIVPLAALATALPSSAFQLVDGRIDLTAMTDVQPVVADATAVLSSASARVGDIDAHRLVSPLAEPIVRLQAMLVEASDVAATMDRAVQLLPGMLGADGPRDYLLLFQNNAELRTAGGIPGALALIRAEDGRISIVEQASTTDFDAFAEPVLPLPESDVALYGSQIGRYIQDVTATPDFELSGRLAAEMWARQRGTSIDGVIAVDPVALSHILGATGPVTLANGDVLSDDDAVRKLLVDAYVRYPENDQQDEYFESVAATVFQAISSGAADSAALVSAFTRIGDEHRISIWSAHPEEQAELVATTLGGMQATQDALGAQAYAVYLNDRTAGKMGPYLDVSASAEVTGTGADGRTEVSVTVALVSTAPADAARVLPGRVLGSPITTVPTGTIATNVTVYSPPNAFDLGIERDGAPISYQSVNVSDRIANNVGVDLDPGESATLVFRFLSVRTDRTEPIVVSTPVLPLEPE